MRGFLLTCVVAAGCSGSSEPAVPAPGFQLKTPEYTLAPGEEKYLCYTAHLNETADIAITAFHSFASDQVHHMEVFQALGAEPEGLNVCDGGGTIKVTWLPLFGGGKNAGGLKLPTGAGFKLPKDALLLVQIHLLNASQAPVTQKVIVNMDYAADPTQVAPAGIFAFGSMTIKLPAGESGTQVTSSCNLPKTMNVFAAQPHMHYLGTKLAFEMGESAPSAQMVYQRAPWSFGGQPIDDWQQSLTEGQFARVTCTYDNTTDHDVVYGESTNNEMCYLVLFYTPFDHLAGCIS